MQSVSREIWEEYQRERSPELRQELAVKYLNLVRLVVMKYRSALINVPGMLEGKDLEQVGALGLLDAIERYDPARGVKFETYAVTRIRGTIQDELRKLDWVPRSVRRQSREDRRTAEGTEGSYAFEVRQMHGTQRNEDTMGETMHATAESSGTIESISPEMDPLEETGKNQMKAMLIKFVEQLPEHDRLIVTLYYYEELTFKEIGLILHVSESCVSQKHSSLMKKLRLKFGSMG